MIRVLVAAGLDPSGRAGLLADVEAIRARKAMPLAVATALTAQGGRTFEVAPTPPALIRRQLAALLELWPIDAVKLGMVPDRAALKALAQAFSAARTWVVIDPVVATSRGQKLSELTAGDYLTLAGPKRAITPNLDEAEWLTGERDPEAAGPRLIAEGFGLAVIKGGHLPGEPIDYVFTKGRAVALRSARLQRNTASHRGTGCRFAATLAVELARERSPVDASRTAKGAVRIFLSGSILR